MEVYEALATGPLPPHNLPSLTDPKAYVQYHQNGITLRASLREALPEGVERSALQLKGACVKQPSTSPLFSQPTAADAADADRIASIRIIFECWEPLGVGPARLLYYLTVCIGGNDLLGIGGFPISPDSDPLIAESNMTFGGTA